MRKKNPSEIDLHRRDDEPLADWHDRVGQALWANPLDTAKLKAHLTAERLEALFRNAGSPRQTAATEANARTFRQLKPDPELRSQSRHWLELESAKTFHVNPNPIVVTEGETVFYGNLATAELCKCPDGALRGRSIASLKNHGDEIHFLRLPQGIYWKTGSRTAWRVARDDLGKRFPTLSDLARLAPDPGELPPPVNFGPINATREVPAAVSPGEFEQYLVDIAAKPPELFLVATTLGLFQLLVVFGCIPMFHVFGPTTGLTRGLVENPAWPQFQKVLALQILRLRPHLWPNPNTFPVEIPWDSRLLGNR
ncbi:MAG: hypothetical protein GY716_24650 [bacterium]|nr:hypothetical protein [bacterium]